MNDFYDAPFEVGHDHMFLGEGHQQNERKTWGVIVLCTVMMLAEIIGGQLFGSLALVADGLHMSTHAGAMLIAALAYTYARKHARDPRFVFGTGKLGDLAGFTSAIILAMIALLIGYEAVVRLLAPVPIRFAEAIPIAVVGLMVNIVSAWLLSGGDHGHSHGHDHGHSHDHDHGHSESHGHDAAPDDHADEIQYVNVSDGRVALSIFESGVPPVFRLHAEDGAALPTEAVTVTTSRLDGTSQTFSFALSDGYLESTSMIPEPHAFHATLQLGECRHALNFTEHDHVAHDSIDRRDNNMRAAYVHIIADAAVSVLAIIGLLMARAFGWLWMDPVAGIVGALVIANWSYGLIRDTGAILTDMSPGDALGNRVRTVVTNAGDQLADLHVWRLGPGHFGAVLSVVTANAAHGAGFYHTTLRRIQGLSHITVEVHARG